KRIFADRGVNLFVLVPERVRLCHWLRRLLTFVGSFRGLRIHAFVLLLFFLFVFHMRRHFYLAAFGVGFLRQLRFSHRIPNPAELFFIEIPGFREFGHGAVFVVPPLLQAFEHALHKCLGGLFFLSFHLLFLGFLLG